MKNLSSAGGQVVQDVYQRPRTAPCTVVADVMVLRAVVFSGLRNLKPL